MSYCLAMKLNSGLVFMSDSRTNAGVDNVASFRKTFIFDEQDDRRVVILVAGNLAITQNIISRLEERAGSKDPEKSIYAAKSMFDIARIIGNAIREVYTEEKEALQSHDVDFSASFIVGGQIKGRRLRLFNLYSAGNFVEATDETPYFQIGETKYGKPIIERVLRPDTSIPVAIKCGVVSFDSTIHSNLSVGLPIHLTILPKDNPTDMVNHLISEDDSYFKNIGHIWAEGLENLFGTLPDPDWVK